MLSWNNLGSDLENMVHIGDFIRKLEGKNSLEFFKLLLGWNDFGFDIEFMKILVKNLEQLLLSKKGKIEDF